MVREDFAGKKWEILCIGELGKLFYDNYHNSFEDNYRCHWIDDPVQIQSYIGPEFNSDNELRMLIAECDQKSWNEYFGNDDMKKVLQKFAVKFIVIHPNKKLISAEEYKFIQMMNTEQSFGIILAMPDMKRLSALQVMSSTIFDMLGALSNREFITIEVFDLNPYQYKINHYGSVYSDKGGSDRTLKEMTGEICSQLKQDIESNDIEHALLLIKSGHDLTLKDLFEAAQEIENTLPEDASLCWGYIHADSEHGLKLVVYRAMEVNWSEQTDSIV